MASWKKVAIHFAVFLTITQMLGCYQTKKESDNKAESIFQYFLGAGLWLNDSGAHDAFFCGENAVNNAYFSAPKPDPGMRITGSLTTSDGIIIDYDWSMDVAGNWVSPSTLNFTFNDYWAEPDMSIKTDAVGVLLYGNCRLDLSGGSPSESQQKRIRHSGYFYLYYYPQPGSTHIIGGHVQSDYTITEITLPDYSKCYAGTFAGRNVIPLVEPGGDGCLP